MTDTPDLAARLRRQLPEDGRVATAVQAVLALHTWNFREGGCWVCDLPAGRYGQPEGCTTVRLIAAQYANRPGYREEWRP